MKIINIGDAFCLDLLYSRYDRVDNLDLPDTHAIPDDVSTLTIINYSVSLPRDFLIQLKVCIFLLVSGARARKEDHADILTHACWRSNTGLLLLYYTLPTSYIYADKTYLVGRTIRDIRGRTFSSVIFISISRS